jgi:DNA-directed RNA polymerase specialized sigma24 family protein
MAAPPTNGRLSDDRLLAALLRLPAHERQTLLLHHFDGHPTPHVATLTGRTLGTITKQLSRAYARLREHLKEKP